MDESLPYRVAYSDGDEQCQKCQEEIGFGCLQVAIMIQVCPSIILSQNDRLDSNVS